MDLSNNEIGVKDREYSTEGVAALSAVLKTNSTIKELNLSKNYINAEAARIFSQDIHDNGALAFLTMHKHKLPVKEIKTAKELDLSNKGLIAIDAIVIAALIKVQTALFTKRDKTKRNSFQDNGALAKLDLSGNNELSGDSPDFIRPIATMLKTNKTIKEINLAGNNLNAEAGRIFSQDIHDNGALASLDISKNSLTQGQQDGTHRYGPLQGQPKYKTDMSGVIVLAEALKK